MVIIAWFSPAGAVTDRATNPMANDAEVEFFVLAGDLNRDRLVNFDDLLILAQNYGLSNRTFSTGNVNYSPDGLVDFSDLLLLSQRYGTSLLTSPLLLLPQVPSASSTTSRRRSLVAL